MTKLSKSSKAVKPGFARWLPWIGAAAVTVIGMLVIIAVVNQTQSRPLAALKTYGPQVQSHTTAPVTYEQTPPVGGPHDPAWQNCGIYEQPIRSENAVHSMEHGALWIAYRPDLNPDDIALLRELAGGRRYLLLSPHADLPTPIVASGWGVQLTVESAGDARLANFITEYMQGPQTPEPGAPCTGGIGMPVG